ncbi:hypothetical protein P9J64_13585 [Deltaproteobacteria bacterium IMCC39524]|nr:hypothetical protein [Deltaproteobacteria bacterium IMCC39524]
MYSYYLESIKSRAKDSSIELSETLEKEIRLGLKRDLQAQKIPPNTPVPRRKNIIKYLCVVSKASGSPIHAFKSLLSPGSWTSSGGSFKLAEDCGYNITDILLEITSSREGKKACNYLEIGAGYAGFLSKDKTGKRAGIAELYDTHKDLIGDKLFLHFTNLSKWHDNLPEGIYEHPAFLGSTLLSLRKLEECPDYFDVIYSQCAAYFDYNYLKFIEQACNMLCPSDKGGLLIFNGKTELDRQAIEVAEREGTTLIYKEELGGMNGTFYVFKKNNV